jgi:hypothetical protein
MSMRILMLIFSLCLTALCAVAWHNVHVARHYIFIGPDSTPRDYTVGQSPICEVHRIQMPRTSVRVAYGMPAKPSALAAARYEASKKAFPNAQSSASGGCCVTLHSPTNAFIYTCSECKKAAKSWDSVYGKR